MARRGGLGQLIKEAARESACQDRLRRQVERKGERRGRQAARDAIARMKDAGTRRTAAYLQDRKGACEQTTADAHERRTRLAAVLADTLAVNDRLAFGSLRITDPEPELGYPLRLFRTDVYNFKFAMIGS